MAPFRLSCVMALVLAGAMPAVVTGQQSIGTVAPLVLDSVTVIDVERGRLALDQRVVIVGNRIATIGSVTKIELPSDMRLVNARGKYLIPGLWDMHAHVLLRPEFNFPFLVANGVTGIRDPNPLKLEPPLQWRQEVMAGRRIGPPRQVLSAPSMHEMKRSDCLQQLQASNGLGAVCLSSPAEAQRIVDSVKAVGADMIKPYTLSRETYFAVAAAARRAGIPFGGHTYTASILEASDSGAGIIDHALAGSPEMVDLCVRIGVASIASCRAVAERFRRNRTWWIPTLTLDVNFGLSEAHPLQPVTDTMLVHFRAFYDRFRHDSIPSRYPLDSVSVAMLRRTSQADSVGVLRLARQVGMPLLAGTDRSPLGFVTHLELAIWVAEGVTPLEALQAATLNPARFLQATDSLGTVAAGKLADLVLLDANPLEEITNTQRIAAVVANGRYFDRAELDRLLSAGRQALLQGRRGSP